MIKKFILNILLWILIPLIVIICIGPLLPTTPYSSTSLIYGAKQKDSLLLNVESPRIIFVGGSNLSFGLNSQMIKDSMGLNPINTAVRASIGLQYMLKNTAKYVKEGDVVVVVFEYKQFLRDYDFGSEELLRTVFDVAPSTVNLLSRQQILNLLPYLPKYSFSKLNPIEYLYKADKDCIYGAHSFNKYADACKHWGKKREFFTPRSINARKYNARNMQALADFQQQLKKKRVTVLVSYPGYQDISFQYSINAIKLIEREYKAHNLTTLGTPERYMMPDSLMFNSPYHLTKQGADLRTRLLIEDLQAALK